MSPKSEHPADCKCKACKLRRRVERQVKDLVGVQWSSTTRALLEQRVEAAVRGRDVS